MRASGSTRIWLASGTKDRASRRCWRCAELSPLIPPRIAFENIDVLLKRDVSLYLATLQRKLVHRRRGGYCFEQNTLLGAALRVLGFHSSP